MKIIAELGSNWTTVEDLTGAVKLAKNAGADYIKYQWFSEKDLYGMGSDERQFEEKMFPILRQYCDKHNIGLMCTVFALDAVDIIAPYVDMFKVASSDMTWLPLIDKMREYNKHIVISTGCRSMTEIGALVKYLGPDSFEHITFLYCISAYPAKRLRLEFISDIREQFGVYTGLSDHSTDIFTIPVRAKELHAEILEKHFNPHGYIATPDAPHSIDYHDFKDMVDNLREALGNYPKVDVSEMDMRGYHHRRLIAIKDIKKGEPFVLGENYGAYRAKTYDTHGDKPFMIYDGKISEKDYTAGEGIFQPGR